MNQTVFALSVAVIGLTVVALILVVLLARSKGTAKSAPVSLQAQPQAVYSRSAAPGIPQEVVAAITAALTAMWQGETGFVIRHVKRINNAPAWNRAGREEQLYSRF